MPWKRFWKKKKPKRGEAFSFYFLFKLACHVNIFYLFLIKLLAMSIFSIHHLNGNDHFDTMMNGPN